MAVLDIRERQKLMHAAARLAGDGVHKTIAEVITTFRRWLYLPDPAPLLAVLAAIAAHRYPGDPVWLLLVGPPGSGKSEILQSTRQLRDVHPAATLTEAALLSGTPKKDTASDARGGLLRTIGQSGIIMAKDFGSVLSMNRDTRGQLLAALRELYDGEWVRHVGVDGGRTLSWSGKLSMIAGCTPAIDNHHAVMAAMGERFLMCRLDAAEDEKQAGRALDHFGKEAEMRAELQATISDMFAVELPPPLPLEQEDRDFLINLASLVVRCRSAVERDTYNREIVSIPDPEAPARLVTVLARLFGGLLAIGCDLTTARAVMQRVGLDSMPALRRTVLDALADEEEGRSTPVIAERIGYPTNTLRRTLEDLTAHGVTERQSQGKGKADLWRLSNWARRGAAVMARATVEDALDTRGVRERELRQSIDVAKTRDLLGDTEVSIAHGSRLVGNNAIHQADRIELGEVPPVLSAAALIVNHLYPK